MTPSRRSFIGALATAPLWQPFATIGGAGVRRARSVAVVGAGAFGGWSALALLRAGVQVTLVDAWGPGNGRASSGGDTRVIRTEYGPQIWYTQMAARAQALWRESQARWNRPLYQRTGLILMVSAEDEYHRAALTVLHDQGIGAAALSPAEAARRFPEVDFSDVQWVLWEEDAGYLRAREACRAVVEAFVTEGGTYRTAAARPGRLTAAGLDGIELSDGTRLVRDTYVFACGPWLPRLFPDVLGDFVTTSRQEVFYFATPEGDSRFDDDRFPVWAHHGERFFYGIPGNDGRGFKIADDTRGPPFDPTREDRVVRPEAVARVRAYLGIRFPALANAPLLETRVCQYANTPDGDFILDRHPGADNTWLVGGGSGHGFKHGPAIGELVRDLVTGRRDPIPMFTLSRNRGGGP